MKSHSLTITAIAAAGAAAYVLVVRPWYLRWGASEDEVRKPLPGDELVPQPKIQSTRAVTIEAPARGGRTWKDVAANVAWELPHFIMERGMLLGIKQRAERIKGRAGRRSGMESG